MLATLMRLQHVAPILLLAAACARPAAPPELRAPTPTSAPRPPTSTPTPDYRGMRQRLVEPLSALIVAVRSNDRAQAAGFLARFNAAGDEILPRIETDVSTPANLLHSAIVNVRAHPGDLAVLEQARQDLIRGIP